MSGRRAARDQRRCRGAAAMVGCWLGAAVAYGVLGCGGRSLPQTVGHAEATAAAPAPSPLQPPNPPQPPERDAFAAGRHRGVCFAHSLGGDDGYGTPASAASLAELRAMGVDWVSITPFGFLADPQATEIRRLRGESDERLRAVTAQAHAAGMRVLLKPHLWLRSPHWVGDVTQHDEEGWRAFFAAYEEHVVHYARLGREAGVDALLVGNELQGTTHREADWRRLIAAARRDFAGPLGYGANHSEAERVPFWDALDFIGVSAYFPLVEEAAPTQRRMVAAWRPILARLGDLSRRWDRRVVFTEIGYPAADWAAWRPWELPTGAASNPRLQADAYAAFLEAAWPQQWLGGAYWWKWFSGAGEHGHDGRRDPFDFRPARRRRSARRLGRARPLKRADGRRYSSAASTRSSPCATAPRSADGPTTLASSHSGASRRWSGAAPAPISTSTGCR